MRGRLITAILALMLAPRLAAQQATAWPAERPPHPLPAHDVHFPPYELRTLANGLQVIAVSHHEQPVVSVRLIVRAGSAQDPGDRPGAAALIASLLDQGTASRSAETIADTIDSIGGTLGSGAGADLSYLTAVVMKDSLGTGLDLVSDMAQHPAFAPEEIERQRQQTLSGMKVSYDDPEYLANIVFDRLVYGPHPYGRPQTGTPDTLASLTRDDLLAFHRRWFGPNNAILAIVGDVSPGDAFTGAERAFGGWARVAADGPQPAPPPAPSRRLVIIDKPGSVQTEIRVGNLAIARTNDDYLTLDLAVKILGGEGANRLHRVLRSERGLTYGASADCNGLAQGGDIMAQTNTRSETTGETLRLMIDEYGKLQHERVGDRELHGAQDYLAGSFPLTIETPSQIALQILNNVFYGLNPKDLQTYRERVNAIAADDIQRVARAYFTPDRLTIVLVGDAKAFVDQLPAAGVGSFERIPVADLDLASPDLRRRPAAPAPRLRAVSYILPSPVPQRPDPARALIDRVIQAKGGLARLQAIRSIRIDSTTNVDMGGRATPFATTTWIEYPNHFRTDAELPAGRVSQIYDGGHYWVRDPAGVKELPDAAVGVVKATVERDTFSLLRGAATGALVVRELDSDDPAVARVEISGKGLPPVTLYIDRSTSLIVRETYDAPEGGTGVEEYSDYRTVQGVKIAYHTVVRREGAARLVRDIKTVHFNAPVPPGTFGKPS